MLKAKRQSKASPKEYGVRLFVLFRYAGQVGYASMGIKSPSEVITGDVFFDGTEAPTTVDYVEPVKHMVGF